MLPFPTQQCMAVSHAAEVPVSVLSVPRITRSKDVVPGIYLLDLFRSGHGHRQPRTTITCATWCFTMLYQGLFGKLDPGSKLSLWDNSGSKLQVPPPSYAYSQKREQYTGEIPLWVYSGYYVLWECPLSGTCPVVVLYCCNYSTKNSQCLLPIGRQVARGR